MSRPHRNACRACTAADVRRAVVFATGLAVLAAAPAAVATPSFDRVMLPDRLEIPRPAALADVTGDGIPDIVLGGSTGLFVMIGEAGGVFPNWRRAHDDHYSIAGVSSADFDEDGCPDVVAGGTTDSSGTAASRILRVYRCAGDGRYERILERRTNVLSPVAGDFNGDGHADIAFGQAEWYHDPNRGGQFRGVVEVQLGDGRGGFAEPIRTVYGEPDTSASFRYMADLNRDGRDDLVLYTRGVLLADGNGGFGAPLRLALPKLPRNATRDTRLHMSDIASGDLDEDGHVDLIVRWFYAARVAGVSYDVQQGVSHLYFGEGDGRFSLPVLVDEVEDRRRGSLDQLLMDTDRDGHLDIVLTDRTGYAPESPLHYLGNSAATEVYRGRGDGTFDAEPVVSPNSGGIFVSDFLFKRVSIDLDLNGDGHRDLLLSTGHAMRVAFGNGDGTFVRARDYGSADFATAAGAAVGDFDADGDVDIVVGNLATSNVSVWLNDGDGGMTGPRNYPVAYRQGPVAIDVADIDEDGNLDLAVASSGDPANDFDDGVSVLLGDGGGGFGAPIPFVMPAATAIAVMDYDLDGRLDLVTVDGRQRLVAIVRDPLGAPQGVGYYDPVNTVDNLWNFYAFVYTGMAVADFDENGWPDVARTSVSGQINVFFNLGSPTRSVVKVPVLFDSRSMRAADLNGDGHADLAVAGVGPKIVTLLGDGQGAFTPTTGRELLGNTLADNITIGELDGSGALSVVSGFYDVTGVNPVGANGVVGNGSDIGAGIVSMRQGALADIDGDGLNDFVASRLVFFNRGTCGDSRTDGEEECDDGNTDDCDGCSGRCRREIGFACGDGITNAACHEECDDGEANADRGDACRLDCRTPRCGDGIVDSGEACDDGNQISCDGCAPSCVADPEPVCGDAVTNRGCGESCDDGNIQFGDGCSGDCRLELVPGGGSMRSDCLVEWKIINPGNEPFYDSRGAVSARQGCRDGDPTCDFDARTGVCAFRLAICASVDDPSLDGYCYPTSVESFELRKPSVLDSSRSAMMDQARASLSLAAVETVGSGHGLCSTWVDVPVEATANGYGRLGIKVRAYGSGRMKDGDSLRLECLP